MPGWWRRSKACEAIVTAKPSDVQHLIIFEPDRRGHAAEWIEHILRKVSDSGYPRQVSLAVPVRLADEIVGRNQEPWQSSVRVLPLRSWETLLCNSRLLSLNGLARWWVMRRRLRQANADHGFFLDIDLLALPLGLGLGFDGRQVSGILYRPSIHYARSGDTAPRLRERLRDLRKSIFYRMMLRNPALRSVRSLDPYFPAYAASRFRHSEKISPVLDPAHPICVEDADNQIIASIPPGRILFIIFGVLSERKGILTLLEALRRLEPRYAAAIAIYAAGEVDPSLIKRIDDVLEELVDAKPELWLRIDNRRLASAEIVALVHRADVVLAPYQRFVGSSGVLLWAAKAGKPVITQDYGLLGQLTREYSLGLAVDTADPSVLAAAIAATVRRGVQSVGDADGMRRFVNVRTPDAFASSVLEGVTGKSLIQTVGMGRGVHEATATD